MKLYINPVSPNSRKPRLVAQHLGLEVEEKVVDLAKGEHRSAEFLARNPNGMVPVLEDDGFCLWESNAICQYLAAQVPGNSLVPPDARTRANIARWQSWELAHLQPAVAKVVREKLLKKLLNQGAPDPAQIQLGEEQFARFAAILNGQLEGRRYLVGDALSLADFTVAPILALAPAVGLDPRQHRHVAAWLDRLAELESWKRTEPPPMVQR